MQLEYVELEIKQIVDGKWQVLPLTNFAGRRPGELLSSFGNTDTVCEIKTILGILYLCGKDKFMQAMSKKGFAVMLCSDAALFYPREAMILSHVVDVFGSPTKEEEGQPEVSEKKCQTIRPPRWVQVELIG